MKNSKIDRVKAIFDQHGPIVKTNILFENKIFSRDIAELLSTGIIRKVKYGYYMLSSTENDITNFELVSSIIPNGIICLQSAALYYDLTMLNPVNISIAIPSNSKKPVLPSHPPIELIQVSTIYFELGLVSTDNQFRIYNKERIVCDLFKKRSTLGMDLAFEVLKNYMSGERKLQLLFEYATKLRINSIVKTYVEALI